MIYLGNGILDQIKESYIINYSELDIEELIEWIKNGYYDR